MDAFPCFFISFFLIHKQCSDPMAAQQFSDAFEELTSDDQFGAVAAPPPPAAPQAVAAVAPAPIAAPKQQPIRQQRRRLSVVDDSVNADGRRSSTAGT